MYHVFYILYIDFPIGKYNFAILSFIPIIHTNLLNGSLISRPTLMSVC
nr:MAG TPA: hypothetical protein [Caudoviricetes sp.]